ncbi:putative inorganic polyphosphate/ATP-NAD kinase [Planctomycetes bacterium Pla163]|uniref:NAD kinase n=1 Tax=Rohdeia mirabilis TaxID=2528008 RepID=A0A518D010_9BACT|nr:putative inorganic polyphosphate/ATP-NAD kinase [Planctomycetes bacterium Pla163]
MSGAPADRSTTASGVTSPIRRVQVLAHSGKSAAVELLDDLVPFLESRCDTVDVECDVLEFVAKRESSTNDLPRPDLMVVLGGDGAMLSAVRAHASAPVPTVGINFGRVGFLASTPVTRWREVLDGILAGHGIVEPRMRLSIRVPGLERPSVALNEVVISRASEDAMLQIALEVGGTWVTDYRSDGLILATPSGSTAYSLSAGGPILAPTLLGVVATPICSQALSNRPLVLHPDSKCSVRVLNAGARAEVVVDGRRVGRLSAGDAVQVERHPEPYPLLTMPDLDPYRRLRERLGWTGGVHEQGADA